jgi:hypothetical protein
MDIILYASQASICNLKQSLRQLLAELDKEREREKKDFVTCSPIRKAALESNPREWMDGLNWIPMQGSCLCCHFFILLFTTSNANQFKFSVCANGNRQTAKRFRKFDQLFAPIANLQAPHSGTALDATAGRSSTKSESRQFL